MNKSQKKKWRQILAGGSAIVSDSDLDAFPFNPRLASTLNPGQVGTLDRWIAYLKK